MAITPAPCPPAGGTSGPEFDTESLVLCDVMPDGSIAGTALAVYKYDEATGAPTGPPTFVNPTTGAPYVAQGTLQPCDEPCMHCETVLLCDTVAGPPPSTVVASTIVMLDTVNVVGDDGWDVTGFNTSGSANAVTTCPGVAGPPVPVPYPAFYSADWGAAWLAGCPGGTPAGGGTALNPGAALGVTADFEGVQCGVGVTFDTACARYTLEKSFNTDAACTKIRVSSQNFRADGSAKVLIDGQQTGIYGQYNAPSPDGTIILTVAPGPHTMTIDLRDSNSPTWVKGGLTIECLDITTQKDVTTTFRQTVCRNCKGDIISTANTDFAGNPYVIQGTVASCGGSGGAGVQPGDECDALPLVDVTTNLSGQQVCTNFLRTICYDSAGTFVFVRDTLMDGASAYTVTGNVQPVCPPIATPRDSDLMVLCDDNGPFLREYVYAQDASLIGTNTTLLDGTTVYVPVGAVHVCSTAGDLHEFTTVVLCDDNGSFTRTFHWDGDQGLLISVIDQDMTTAVYVPVGAVKSCDATCCPAVVGSGCATGGRKWTALRDSNGTVTLYDQATGAVVLSADVVACADNNAIALPAVAAHHFNVVAAGPWTPAVIPAGRLVALSYTVVADTVTTIDADGTNIAAIPAGFTESWSTGDDRETLIPPQSITATATGRAIVTMLVANP